MYLDDGRIASCAAGPRDRDGDVSAMEMLVSLDGDSAPPLPASWILRLLDSPYVDLRIFACAYHVPPVGAERSRDLAAGVPKSCRRRIMKLESDRKFEFQLHIHLQFRSEILWSSFCIPLYFWMSSDPLYIRIRESVEVMSTSDGLEGANCEQHK